MKKLLFITWSVSYGYGTEKSLADVLNRMDRRKYDISVLPLFKYTDNTILSDDIQMLDPLIDYTAEDFNEQKALEQYYEMLSDPLKFNRRIKERYDCVIACNHNAPSYFASYIRGAAKLIWIRGDMSELDYHRFEEDSSAYKLTKQEHDMQAKVLRSFDSIVVISDIVKKMLKKLFGITDHVVKISNSVDREKIISLSSEQITLPEKVIFTSPGRLDYNKNQILLLEAAKEIKNERDDFMICLLGDGEERGKLEEFIKINQLDDNVRILGFVENPYPFIRNSAATVLTSFSEGFSLVLVESLILNTPIISTKVGVAEELIEKYKCGDLVGYDVKELSGILLKYLDKYDGCKALFETGNEFDIKTEADKTAALIDRTLNEKSAQKKMKKLSYPEITIFEPELDSYHVKAGYKHVLRVMKDGIPYEFLIHRKQDNDKMIVFHNGAVAEGDITVPVFQRHSWSDMLKTSSIFCMDPTLYLSGSLQVGWGIGKNDNYFLENCSFILKKIIGKMGIRLEDTVIFGTSAGGFMSVIMGIYLKGAKVLADNAQLDIRNWIFKDALDSAIAVCFDNIGDALRYQERFSAVAAFEKNQYVPPVFLHVNICSKADNSTQLVPFLKAAESMSGIKDYNRIKVILHYEEEKGHNGIDMDERLLFCIRFWALIRPCLMFMEKENRKPHLDIPAVSEYDFTGTFC